MRTPYHRRRALAPPPQPWYSCCCATLQYVGGQLMESVFKSMESLAKGLITEEEMNERLAFATAKWRMAQAEIERQREEISRLRNNWAWAAQATEVSENNAKKLG